MRNADSWRIEMSIYEKVCGDGQTADQHERNVSCWPT